MQKDKRDEHLQDFRPWGHGAPIFTVVRCPRTVVGPGGTGLLLRTTSRFLARHLAFARGLSTMGSGSSRSPTLPSRTGTSSEWRSDLPGPGGRLRERFGCTFSGGEREAMPS